MFILAVNKESGDEWTIYVNVRIAYLGQYQISMGEYFYEIK